MHWTKVKAKDARRGTPNVRRGGRDPPRHTHTLPLRTCTARTRAAATHTHANVRIPAWHFAAGMRGGAPIDVERRGRGPSRAAPSPRDAIAKRSRAGAGIPMHLAAPPLPPRTTKETVVGRAGTIAARAFCRGPTNQDKGVPHPARISPLPSHALPAGVTAATHVRGGGGSVAPDRAQLLQSI